MPTLPRSAVQVEGSARATIDSISDADVIRTSWDAPTAFEEIFRRHHTTVYRYIARKVGPDAGAELAAEVFVQAFASRFKYRCEYPSARPWLFGISANLMRRHMRRRRRAIHANARLVGELHATDSVDLALDRIEAQAMAPEVVTRVNGLRDREREVLLLYAFTDLTYQEIARKLGIPTGTVRSRLARARQRFRGLSPDSVRVHAD